MRRTLLLFLILMLALLTFVHVSSAETNGTYIAVAVNDKLIAFPDAKPEVRGDTTYLPVRFFAEEMGANVAWHPDTDITTITKGDTKITLDLNQKLLTKNNGTPTPFELYMKDNRTMAPYRAIGESFGYDVSYITKGPIARIKDSTAKLSDDEFYATYKTQIIADKHKRTEEQQAQNPPEKVAYLTFDDGPNAYTEQILNTLDVHGAQATFFMLAPQINKYPQEAKRMYDEGHSVGLHGVTHDASQIYVSPQTVVSEMEACNTALTSATGFRTSLIRVPYGSKPWMPQNYRDAVASAGYHMWDWNIDSYDSRAASVPADQIVAEVTRQVQGKKKAVILLHDKKTTVEALPRILTMLEKQGYAFARIYGSTPPVNFWNDER